MPTNQKSELDARLVNPLVAATTEVLSTMASTSSTLKNIDAAMDYRPSGDISAVIAIIGDDGEGMVALSFPLQLASLLVSRLLGSRPEQLTSEDRSDGIGELVNMISGSAKATLSQEGGQPYKLSLPTIILGAGHEIGSRPRTPYLVLEFETEGGETFHLQVCFKSK